MYIPNHRNKSQFQKITPHRRISEIDRSGKKMQPANSTFSDLYAHQRHHQYQTSQYYSHFPSQNPNPNPNPYPLHQQRHLQIDQHFTSAVADPDPPGVNAYLRSYPISHVAHHAGDFTYSHAIGAAVAPPPTYVSDLVTRNWAAEESVQHYRNCLYAVGATVSHDVSLQQLPAIPTHSTWTNPNPTGLTVHSWKKIPKKTKIAQSAWCEICKIACNTGDVLYKHKLGKKHIKNVEKLISAASGATTSTTTTTSNQVIGPVEKPKGNSGMKKKAETRQDLEIKRMKVLQGGAASNAVRTCTICNVVCNSDTVFKFHLAGQKHASMLKQLQQPGAA